MVRLGQKGFGGAGAGLGVAGFGGVSLISQLLNETVLDLDADKDVTTVGGKVSSWADQSGGGHDATQGTDANRPTYTASNANYGHAATVDFDGTQYLLISDHADLRAKDGFQIWVVGNGNFSANAKKFISKSIGTLEPSADWQIGDGAGVTYGFRVRGTSANYAAVSSDYGGNNPTLHRGRFRDGECRFRVSSAAELVDTSQTGVTTGTDDIGIGMNPNGDSANTGLIGSIARILFIRRWLTDTENAAMDAYLTARYGVAA